MNDDVGAANADVPFGLLGVIGADACPPLLLVHVVGPLEDAAAAADVRCAAHMLLAAAAGALYTGRWKADGVAAKVAQPHQRLAEALHAEDVGAE